MNRYTVMFTFYVTVDDVHANNVSDAIQMALTQYSDKDIRIKDAIVSGDTLDTPVCERVGI